jgi:hypothetical protein
LKIFVKLVLIIIAVALGRFGYEKVIDLPYFQLDEIIVEGDCFIEKDSLVSLSGLDTTRSVYRQNIDHAVQMISDQPGVVECEISRGFISSVKIEIQSAEPALCIIGDKDYGLSREGIVLPTTKNMPVLPFITGRRFSNIKCYDRLRSPNIAFALEIYEGLMAASPELCSRLSEINFGRGGDVNLYFSPDGTIVKINKRSVYDSIIRVCSLDKEGYLTGRDTFDLRYGTIAIKSSSARGSYN